MVRFALILLLLASAHGPALAQTLDDSRLGVSVWASGLDLPTSMAFLGPDDVLVTEKGGILRRVVDGGPPTQVAAFQVHVQSERGLLGVAASSASPPEIFLFMTEAEPGGLPLANRVYRYTWVPQPGSLSNPRLILDMPVSPGPNHNGGKLLLGPPGEAPGVGDGALLYAIIGDLNRNGQLQNFPAGPLPDDTGVVLRVRQDGSAAPGNPFTAYCSSSPGTPCAADADCAGGVCVTEVTRYFAYGIRNGFGLALDPLTGALWDTENGPASYDEVNRLAPGTNSGWEPIMGPDARDPGGQADLFVLPGSAYSEPEFSWLDTVAPTAIVFPFDASLGPDYRTAALVGDNNFGQLYRFPLDAARTGFDLDGFAGLEDGVADSTAERNAVRMGSGFGVITDLQIGTDGHLYLLSLSHGRIYRITGPYSVPFAPLGALLALSVALALALRRRLERRASGLA